MRFSHWLKTLASAAVLSRAEEVAAAEAMLLAAKHPQEVKALATWSSVGDMHKDFLEELGQPAFDRAASEGIVGLDLGWRTIVLKKGFFDSLATHDLGAAIASFPGPYLSVTGDQDFSAAYAKGFVETSKAVSARSL